MNITSRQNFEPGCHPLWRELAAFGAMTLMRGELTAQVGLLVYFPVLVLMSDGIDIVDRERLKRFFEPWRRKLALKRRAPHSAAIG